MKLFSTKQIAGIDRYTIENEPVSSTDLMERASTEMFKVLSKLYGKDKSFVVFSGSGNNGGDGLVLARLLHNSGYNTRVYLADYSGKLSPDCKINYERLKNIPAVKTEIITGTDTINLDSGEIIIDALFGSGLTRKVEGLSATVIRLINASGCEVVSVDIPSGLFGEDNTGNNPETVVKANYTLTLQFPKISFFFRENEKFTGKWIIVPIGLSREKINSEYSLYYYLEKQDIRKILPVRSRFSHKGDFGHALLITGSYGKAGASVLAAKACLRAGAGLLTTYIPSCGYNIVQISVPESMVITDNNENFITKIPELDGFSSVGIGPGLGQHPETSQIFQKLLTEIKVPLVIDADGLNIIAGDKALLELIPENTVLTPHPKEFDRLCGESASEFERLDKAVRFAQKYKLIVVLKGAYTRIISAEGEVYFNSTGNPGMATGGSGDVLTGIILGFLSQKCKPLDAALAGVYMHGLAGDIAAGRSGVYSLIAGDITENLAQAFKEVL